MVARQSGRILQIDAYNVGPAYGGQDSVRHIQDREQSVVCVIDDDAAMRVSMDCLIRSIGLNVRLYSEPREFLSKPLPNALCCLVLDVRLPHLSGLEFQSELAQAGIHIPIIFITGFGDIPMCAKAMKAGAVEFLTKPFRDQDLLDAIQVALQRDKEWKHNEQANASLALRFSTLSSREQEIMALVTGGLMNKQIAGKLNISEATVKLHRSNVMRKMQAASLPDLVKMADTLRSLRQGATTDWPASSPTSEVNGHGVPLAATAVDGRAPQPARSFTDRFRVRSGTQ